MNIFKSEAGSCLAEYAIVFPIMLLVWLGGIDLGVMAFRVAQTSYWLYNADTRGGRRDPCCTDAASTLAYAIQQTGIAQGPPPIRHGDPPQAWVLNWTTAGCGIFLQVTTRFSFMFLPGGVPVSLWSCAPSCFGC